MWPCARAMGGTGSCGSRPWMLAGRAGPEGYYDPSGGDAFVRTTNFFFFFKEILVIVITSFKPSSDRHHPQLPSFVRHEFSSPVGCLVCGLVFGLRARPSVGRLVCGRVMSMIFF